MSASSSGRGKAPRQPVPQRRSSDGQRQGEEPGRQGQDRREGGNGALGQEGRFQAVPEDRAGERGQHRPGDPPIGDGGDVVELRVARHLRQQGEIAEHQRLADHRALGAADNDQDRHGDDTGEGRQPRAPGEGEPEQQQERVGQQPQGEVARP